MKLRVVLFQFLFCTAVLFAQGQQDPPSRVARLNWLNGSVSFQPAGIDTWTAATVNYPLTTGDHIYTDTSSRAEMHIGANAIRLNELSNFGYLNLDDRTVQVRFAEGSMEVRLRHLEDDDLYEIDTPQGAITLLRGGDYRIDTDPNRNATLITVRAGEAEVTANGQSFPVHPRQTAYFAGDGSPDIRSANDFDDFDRFTESRNRFEDTPPPHQYVPTSMPGGQDLYAYGSWRNVPGYGTVWVPPGGRDWAPYRYGHWAWVEPWGWTWIDDAPWGFAPFHYGRWAHADFGWYWVPGPVAVRPVYAPALVAFVGGPRFNLAISVGGGGGGVAWFPLGPREVYQPAYHVSNTYVNRVNVTNVTNITNVTNVTNVNVTNVKYVNQTVPGAVTAVPQQAFVSRQSVNRAMQPVSQQQLQQAQVVGSTAAIAPQRASLVGTQNARVAQPSQATMMRPVVARQTPPPPPVSFVAKQQAYAQNPGRPPAPEAIQTIRTQQRAAVVAAPVRPATAPAPLSNRPAVEATRPVAPRPAPAVPSNPTPVAPQRPADRFDSRPPNARPLTSAPSVPAPTAESQRPAAQPRQETPRPAAVAPTPARPEAKHEARQEKKAERKVEKKDEKKEEKKN